MKIQIIGTIIDFIGDANTVYGEEGSQNFTEFLARAGVSVAKAGATAAIGSVIAAGLIPLATSLVAIAMGTAASTVVLPVLGVLVVVVGGYILAATVVDTIDNRYNIKNSVAGWAN
ncbi:hypothetical protein ACFDR9_005607 [Janthinobacterium sp. CG_23.3]